MTGRAEKTDVLRRLETFTDAVIAVAMTILVLDLKTPEISVAIRRNHLDYSFLVHQAPKLFAFLVSFFLIGIGWIALVHVFRSVTRVTPRLIWFTLFYLFFTCLVPWASAFWSEHLLLPQAVGLYNALWAIICAIATLLQRHAATTFYPNDEIGSLNFKINVAASTLVAVAAVLSAFVTVYAGLFAVLVTTVAYIVPRRSLMTLLERGRGRGEGQGQAAPGGAGADPLP